MPPMQEIVATVEHELEQATPWARRRGLTLDWEASELRLRTVLEQGETEEPFFLQGTFDSYKELPPVWEFYDADWHSSCEKRLYPAKKPCPFGSSMFLTHQERPVICAPFNRLAYQELAGPHSNWGGPANWRSVEGNHVKATVVGEMLQHIRRHLRPTRGRMG